jgi:hypothetical protein
LGDAPSSLGLLSETHVIFFPRQHASFFALIALHSCMLLHVMHVDPYCMIDLNGLSVQQLVLMPGTLISASQLPVGQWPHFLPSEAC